MDLIKRIMKFCSAGGFNSGNNEILRVDLNEGNMKCILDPWNVWNQSVEYFNTNLVVLEKRNAFAAK